MANEDQNITAYERVFVKCMKAAKRIKEKYDPDLDIYQVGEMMFNRYWEDQIELLKSKIAVGPTQVLADLMESRAVNLG
jgi:hypothetical protein